MYLRRRYQEGVAKGREEGLELGKQEGRHETQIGIAKELLRYEVDSRLLRLQRIYQYP